MTISKKVLIPVVLILCAAFFCGGFWTQKLLSSQTVQASAPADTNTDEVSLLDAAHEQRLAEAVSNAETEDVNEEYVQKYKELINRCHVQLMSVAMKDLQASLPQEQEAWENYVQALLDMQMDYYEEYFYGGSIPPVLITHFEYDLYKERALFFQEICENITSRADGLKQYIQFMTEWASAPDDKAVSSRTVTGDSPGGFSLTQPFYWCIIGKH